MPRSTQRQRCLRGVKPNAHRDNDNERRDDRFFCNHVWLPSKIKCVGGWGPTDAPNLKRSMGLRLREQGYQRPSGLVLY